MNGFKMRNELGVEYDYYIVAYANYSGETYAIYTDLVNDGQDGFRLFSGKVQENKIYPIDQALAKIIINDFKREESNYYEKAQEI